MQRSKKLTKTTISKKNIQQKLLTNIIITPVKVSTRKIFAHTDEISAPIPMAYVAPGYLILVLENEGKHPNLQNSHTDGVSKRH